ncbi:MAG: hypothetical protein QXN59_00385 [Candidatus Micrarchaeaceae archaeon]
MFIYNFLNGILDRILHSNGIEKESHYKNASFAYQTGNFAFFYSKGKVCCAVGAELENPKAASVPNIEDALSKLRLPIRIMLELRPQDFKNIKDELDFKVAKIENKLKSIPGSSKRWRVEAKYLETKAKKLREIANEISSGVTPFKASFYIFAISSSSNEEHSEHEAVYCLEAARRQFESLYSCRSRMLSGMETLRALGCLND